MAVTSKLRHMWENGGLIAYKTGRMWASFEENKLKMVIARSFGRPSHRECPEPKLIGTRRHLRMRR